MQAAVARGEGDLGRGGAFLVSTGRHTGRSPKDKFVVREPSVEPHVWWENNAPMAPEPSPGCSPTCARTSAAPSSSCRTSTPAPTPPSA